MQFLGKAANLSSQIHHLYPGCECSGKAASRMPSCSSLAAHLGPELSILHPIPPIPSATLCLCNIMVVFFLKKKPKPKKQTLLFQQKCFG